MLAALCVNVTACIFSFDVRRWRGCVHLQYRWVANYNDDDQTKEVKMICRSLVCCRLELHQNRTATTLKVKAEFDRRGAQKILRRGALIPIF